jgi:hypothetical protein
VQDRRAWLVILDLGIHIRWNVLTDERMEAPIHAECFRSGAATTLIFWSMVRVP